MIIIHILISITSYFILMLLSTNLLGLFTRGLFANPTLEKLKPESDELIKQEIKKTEHISKWINVTAFLAIIGYLYITFYFWNIGVTAIALLLMIVRLPDLLQEIKTGKKFMLSVSGSTPQNALNHINTFLSWVSLPALYYFLYHF